MPMYEYQCGACGHRLEALQKFSDKALKACPKCKKTKLERLLSSSSIQFKGTGWYVTDYARKASPEQSSSEKGGAEEKSAVKESKSESVAETKVAKPAAPADGKSAASKAAGSDRAHSASKKT